LHCGTWGRDIVSSLMQVMLFSSLLMFITKLTQSSRAFDIVLFLGLMENFNQNSIDKYQETAYNANNDEE